MRAQGPGDIRFRQPPESESAAGPQDPAPQPPLPGYRDTVCPRSPVPVPLRGQEQRGGPAKLRGAERAAPPASRPPPPALLRMRRARQARHGAPGLRSTRTPCHGQPPPTDSASLPARPGPTPRGWAQFRARAAGPCFARCSHRTPRAPTRLGTPLGRRRTPGPPPSPQSPVSRPFPALPPPARAPAAHAPPPNQWASGASAREGQGRGATCRKRGDVTAVRWERRRRGEGRERSGRDWGPGAAALRVREVWGLGDP